MIRNKEEHYTGECFTMKNFSHFRLLFTGAFFLLLAALALVLLSSSALAASNIHGTVTDAETDDPIEEADVYVYDPENEKGSSHKAQTDGQGYYEVEVVRDSWTPETALFLPRGLALSELMKLLPQEKVFGFDDAAARMELEYYSVPQADRPFIIDALSQVGMVPYRQEAPGRGTKKPSYRLFRVGVMDGTISTTLVR